SAGAPDRCCYRYRSQWAPAARVGSSTRSVGPIQYCRFLRQQALVERGEDNFVGALRAVQFLDQPLGDDGLLIGVQVARIKEEMAMLGLVVAHDDRAVAACQSAGQ